MSFLSKVTSSCRSAYLRLNTCFAVGDRLYAKSVLGSLTGKAKLIEGALQTKKRLPVETDPHKLVNYCCGSNIYKEGEDIKLKDNSEYPDWLWNLRLGPPPPLDEMDPNTKEYWEHCFFLQHIRKKRLKRAKIKKKMFVNEGDKIFKLRQLRFRALAYKYGTGYDVPPKFDKSGFKII